MQIALVPIGAVDSSILEILGDALSWEFGGSFLVAEPLPNPDHAYVERRSQYLSDAIMAQLSGLALSADRVLAVVDLDLYTSELNFIFGQANISGRDAIIALPRLRQEYYGLVPDRTLFQERAVKEAVHELGHTFGLRHCRNAKCVMRFSNSLQDVDRKHARFCPSCRRKLAGSQQPSHY